VRFTIEGLNQEQLVAWKLDATDAVLIRWFADFYHGATMTKIEHEGKEYGWLHYQHAIDELPCVGIANKKVLSRRFAKYTACGLMALHIKKSNKGTFSCYHIVPEKWDTLTSKAEGDSAGYSKVPCAEDSKVPSAGYSKVQPKDSLSNDPKSAGVPARQASPSPAKRKETPQSRSISLFFELYRKRTGKEAPWTRGKDHALLSADLRRLGEERLAAALRSLFEAPPARMSSFRYATVHVFLPDAEKRLVDTELAYSKRLRLLKTCKACGKASETTGIDCPKCGEPDAYQVREARHA